MTPRPRMRPIAVQTRGWVEAELVRGAAMLRAPAASDAHFILEVLGRERAIDASVRAAHLHALRRGAQRALPRRTTV